MWFEDNLTEDDVRRTSEIPVTPRALAAGHIAMLEACDSVCQEVVIAIIQQLNPATDRRRALVGLFYRIMGFAKTATELQSPVHQQSLRSAERSVCSQAVHGIAECMMSALKIMGQQLNIHAQFEWYDLVLEKLSHVASFTVADNALIAKGESRC